MDYSEESQHDPQITCRYSLKSKDILPEPTGLLSRESGGYHLQTIILGGIKKEAALLDGN
jgi:hypothetical protein